MTTTRAAIGLICTWLLSLPITVSAATTPASATPTGATDELQEIVVFARAKNLVGKATAASEGAVGGSDLLVRPMLRVADLLEAVPGLIAAQHSGSGKANQYFLRGFNLDHGTDFTTYVDDVPLNLRTHGHGQGYLDSPGAEFIANAVENAGELGISAIQGPPWEASMRLRHLGPYPLIEDNSRRADRRPRQPR